VKLCKDCIGKGFCEIYNKCLYPDTVKWSVRIDLGIGKEGTITEVRSGEARTRQLAESEAAKAAFEICDIQVEND
jgi:hypothetical protein